MVIPKPLCRCHVCVEARQKGEPYARTGPSAFLHDGDILIDTPAEIAWQLNRSDIGNIDHLVLTHLDPDHIEGLRVVEQMTLDFRTWRAYPEKRIKLTIPAPLARELTKVQTVYGSQIDFFLDSGFVDLQTFERSVEIRAVRLTALPVNRDDRVAYIYVFEKGNEKLVYAPCDIKPFPEDDPIVRDADVLLIQPGIVEGSLKHGFVYPKDHISRTTLYTLDETIGLSRRIRAKKTVFIHLEEYWNLGFSDYERLALNYEDVWFAHDGMHINTRKKEDNGINNQ